MLTIKDVLDKFADSHGELKVSDSSQFQTFRVIRSDGSQCPLQVATQHTLCYTDKAEAMGLKPEDISAIIRWADMGKWRIHFTGEI